MIFSNKIYKINSGTNPTLFANDKSTLSLYLLNKTLKHYLISLNNNKKSIFQNEYNYKQLIQLDNEYYCPCYNNYITLINKNDL